MTIGRYASGPRRASGCCVAKSLEYTPNGAARALRLASSGALCVVAHDIAHPLHGETLRGAQMRADRAGYVVLLGDAEELAHKTRIRTRTCSARVSTASSCTTSRSSRRCTAPASLSSI